MNSTPHSKRLWHPIWYFSLSALLVIIILPLTRQGMFMDGVFYAAIAKNLSLGYGSLWQPFYSHTDYTVFYEHPPLAIYFQSLFFKFFGTGFGVEQFYSFLMALGQFSLISWYWLKRVNATFIYLGLLLFVWILIPLNHLYVCNILEGTLTLFTTLATLILLIRTKLKSTLLIQYTAGAITVLIAFLCNGPTALFTLMVPFIYEITEDGHYVYEGLKRTIFFLTIVAIVFTSFYLLEPEALINTKKYFDQQLLASITGTRQLNYVGLKHLNVLILYLRAYWLVTIFSILCILIAAKIDGRNGRVDLQKTISKKEFLLFFSISLISSLPVGISHKQAFSYIMQSAPFYSLAMMYLCFEPCMSIARHFKTKPLLFRRLFRSSYICFIASLLSVISLANGFNSNKGMIKDIYYLSHYLENGAVISTSPAIYFQWYTGAYFARHSLISITPNVDKKYYLALKSEIIPKNYYVVNLPLSYYKLAVNYNKKLVHRLADSVLL
jgi:hypothetical protein